MLKKSGNCSIPAENEYLKRLADTLNPCHYILEKINREIVENPPVQSNKGGIMATGVNQELDELRKIASGGKEYLLQLQQKESGDRYQFPENRIQ